jgi:hypothetical protein
MPGVHPMRPFLLLEGGPLYRIEQRLGLIRDKRFLVKRRAFLTVLVTWVPLVVFSLLQGAAYGAGVALPLLHDFAVHAKFLISVPLLVIAEWLIAPHIAKAAEQFVISEVVEEGDFERFDAAVERGLRLRDSVVAEIIILALAYVSSVLSFVGTAVHVSTWYELRTTTGASMTLAGWWYMGIALPLLKFLVLRWIWRLFLWFQFLATMSALDLRLLSTHPDGAGGLIFVGHAQQFFGVLLFAYSTSLCGVLANEIVYDKLPLQHFVPMIALYVVLAVGIIAGPLFVFSRKMRRVKREGIFQYGALGTACTQAFHRKWITGPIDEAGSLLGTRDIQSLAGLANSYEVIEKMNAFPMNPRSLIRLIVASLLPMTLLLLAVMPLKQLLQLLMKVLV